MFELFCSVWQLVVKALDNGGIHKVTSRNEVDDLHKNVFLEVESTQYELVRTIFSCCSLFNKTFPD